MIPSKTLPGQRPDRSSRTQDGMIDAISAMREEQNASRSGDHQVPTTNKGNVVYALNNTGGPIPQYGVIQLLNTLKSAPSIDSGDYPPRAFYDDELDVNRFKQYVFLEAKITSGKIEEVLGIAQLPCGANTIGRFLVDGVTQCKVSIFNEDEDRMHFAIGGDSDIGVPTFMVTPSPVGQIEILWNEPINWDEVSASITVWAVVAIKGSVPDPLIYFELTEALAYGSSTTAHLMLWDADQTKHIVTEKDIVVQDSNAIDSEDDTKPLRGLAAPNGTRGCAIPRIDLVYESYRVVYEIIQLFHKARFINFELTAALETTHQYKGATVDNFWDGLDPDPDDEGIVVWNRVTHTPGTYIFEGDIGDKGMAVYDEKGDTGAGCYRIWQMECP